MSLFILAGANSEDDYLVIELYSSIDKAFNAMRECIMETIDMYEDESSRWEIDEQNRTGWLVRSGGQISEWYKIKEVTAYG